MQHGGDLNLAVWRFFLRLQVMRLKLNIIFSGVIVILAYKSTTAFRFTSWLLSVMNKGLKDWYKPLSTHVGSLCSSQFTTRAIVIRASLFIKKADLQPSLV